MIECLQIIVTGRVQGVYFRDNTQKQARNLGLHGFVRNLPDKSVEIVVQGEATALQQLLAWSHKGPLLAKVETVACQPHPLQPHFNGFSILR
jgi:acylphosphatase